MRAGLRSLRCRVPMLCVAVVMLCGLGAGSAWALSTTRPDASAREITACANRKTGALRIATKCTRTETKVSWSTVGPVGPQGATGATGPAGVAGPAGAPGSTGPAGPSTGAAGGALAGTYPDPSLNITGGDDGATQCTGDGEALTGVSALGVLTCTPIVFTLPAEEDTAVGPLALPSHAGAALTAVGELALHSATSATTFADAFGISALQVLTTGLHDDSFGAENLEALTSGSDDSALGFDGLSKLTTGGEDVALGSEAGQLLRTGSNDVLLGDTAGASYSGAESNDIVIGSNVNGTTGESNVIRIGNGATQTFISGIAGVTPPSVSGSAPVAVLVNSNGQLGVQSSSIRFKRDIRPLGASAISELLKLRPVSFRYRESVTSGPWPVQFGLIAEQVAKVLPNLVSYGPDHQPDGVAYQELPALLLAAVKAQQHQLRNQAGQIRSQARELARQQGEIAFLMRHLRGRS